MYKPKDKALVEGAVKIIYTSIFTKIDEAVYHNLDTLNTAISSHLDAHNNTLLTGCDYSRRQQFEALEKDVLKPLNKYGYDPMTAKMATVGKTGYVTVANFRYKASIEQLDYTDERGLDKNLVQRLSNCGFIKKGSPKDPAPVKSAGTTILSAQIRSLLTKSRPMYKGILGFDYNVKKWNFNLNNTLFGPTEFQDLDNGGSLMNHIKQEFKPKVVTDVTIGYDFTEKISATVTVSNVFNVLPKWELKALDQEGADYLSNAEDKSLLEGFLTFSGRYRILGYNGSHFSQLGTIFQGSLIFKFK